MSMNPDMLIRDLNHMQLSGYPQQPQQQQQQYASLANKKVAPLVPPKPKNDMYVVGAKSNGVFQNSIPPNQALLATSETGGGPIYSNVSALNDFPPPPPPSQLAQPQVYSGMSGSPQGKQLYHPPPHQNYSPPPPHQNYSPPPPPPPPPLAQQHQTYTSTVAPQSNISSHAQPISYAAAVSPNYKAIAQPQQPQNYNADLNQSYIPPTQPQVLHTVSSHSFPPPPSPQVSYSPPTIPKYSIHPPPNALGAPASPGGSTYETQSGYATFRPQSSASSYDASSIYEPITPRPPSQMSNRSNYSLGSGGSSLYSSYYPANRGKGSAGQGGNKEAEVDRLTDLMVQNLENSNDPDFYGMCYRCGEKVLGEGSGCTAMDHMYHISCFTCHVCHKELRGKPFYAKDGKPYCEEDYLNTLEKCCVCSSRILDRILRATGKPYHPNCFTCVVCGKCLDSIPFTVDATNQIYCIDDFHKKFAPRCCVCKEPIMPEPGKEETVRVVALDRSFHVQCYCCEDCGLQLSDAENSCYPLDDHILCRSCNAKRVQALCSSIITEL